MKMFFVVLLDGSVTKNNVLVKDSTNNIVWIILYFDEMNLTDTASSRPTQMGMFYFILANILLAFIGDNPAAMKIGGYKKSFIAEHCCRYCMAGKEQLRTMTKEDLSLLRTKDQYNDQIKKMINAKSKKEFNKLKTEFGLNTECVLNTLTFFHIVGGLLPNFFNDIIEDSLLKSLRLILIRFLTGKSKVMSLKTFNENLMQFDYGYSETKPSKILDQHLAEGGTLHQTGSQIWSLGVILTPLILGPHIDSDDKYWKNYMLLVELLYIVCGHEISLEMIAYLEVSVEEYLFNFELIYQINLTPKQHFLVHYPRFIMMYGPLYTFMTFRMEAKHQYFKNIMSKIKCLKNPSQSMANQHQLHQSIVLEELKNKNNEEKGVLKTLICSELPFQSILPDNIRTIVTASWIKKDGIKYQPHKCYVMIDYVNRLPQFGLVVSIVYLQGELQLVYRTVRTLEFALHFCGYKILIEEEYNLHKIENLHVPDVYHSHEVDKDQYIIVRRSVGDIH